MGVRILRGDCRFVLRTLPEQSVHCCVTSPPYFGLRDYGVDGQIGLEQTPDAFVAEMVAVFREVRRVLRDDGTLWLNLGDSYNGGGLGGGASKGNIAGSSNRDRQGVDRATLRVVGLKPKDLIGIPWRVAFALQADGWYLRQDIIWHKPNPMPESVTDRCTKAHEYIFLLSKSARYFYDAGAVKESSSEFIKSPNRARADTAIRKGMADPRIDAIQCGGVTESRNRRSVWTVATEPFSGAHFATFPPSLIEPCILAGCPVGGTVLDPFGGAGTTGLVADRLQRNAILVELNPAYADMARRRIETEGGMFASVEMEAVA